MSLLYETKYVNVNDNEEVQQEKSSIDLMPGRSSINIHNIMDNNTRLPINS